MSIRLIVNADDYGRTAGVSAGIREAHLRGLTGLVNTAKTCYANAAIQALSNWSV